MFELVRYTIEKYQMISPGEKIIIGVSGGADSMALLCVLKDISVQGNFSICVAHVEHGLRGAESLEDARFVQAFCEKEGIPFYLKQISASDISREQKISVEMAGRVSRYGFFDELMKKLGGHKIAVAHHMDDQAESFFLHLFRGSGLKGLGGMEPIRDGVVIRPLLEVTRAQIIDYCHGWGIPYRVDQSNFESDYTRNKIRLELVPFLSRHFNERIVSTISRTADILREDEDFLNRESLKVFDELIERSEKGLYINLKKFLSLHQAVKRRIIRRAIEALQGSVVDIELKHIDDVLNLAMEGRTGSGLDLPGGLKIRKGYGELILSILSETIPEFHYPLHVPGRTRIPEINRTLVCTYLDEIPSDIREHSPWIQYFDAEAWPKDVVVRRRKAGDRIHPLGSEGSRKLKEYFIDRKIDRWKRDAIPLIACESRILWAVGYDMAEEVKVSGKTQKVLKIELI